MGCGSSKTLPVTPEGPGSPNGRKESVLVAPSPDHVSTPVGEDQRSKGTFGEGSEGSGGANDVLFKKGSEEVEGRGRRMKNGSAEKTKKKLKDISPPRGNSGKMEWFGRSLIVTVKISCVWRNYGREQECYIMWLHLIWKT